MKLFKGINSSLFFAVVFLSLIGVIYSFETQGNLKSFLEQLFFVAAGFVIMLFFSNWHVENFKKYSILMISLVFVFLLIVLIPGIGLKVNGARRWINLGLTSFQPTEYVKLALILFLAHWFENEEKGRNVAFFLLSGFIFLLIMLEPDMGTALIILMLCFSMFIVSKTTNVLKILAFLPFIFLVIFVFIKTSSYRSSRIESFLNINKEKYGDAYHVNQALISVGSGGLFGVGIGKSKQKYSYLPENNTDSIFGIIAEETGFVGSMAVILCYFMIFYQGFKIMKVAGSEYAKFVSFGIVLFFSLQAFINFSSMLSLIPLTGVPLPLISSGGSALLVQFAGVGILLNINKLGKKNV